MVLSKKPGLGQRLRNERQRLNWSQKRLADSIGTTPSTINRWEHDKVLPQPYYREKLLHIFGANAPDLFSFDNVLVPRSVPVEEQSVTSSLSNLPCLRNIYFTGRGQLLARLHEKLTITDTEGHPQLYALSGMGGIGKTQIAIEYVYRYGDTYETILWIHAETYQSLLADFVELAHLFDLPEKQEADQHAIIAAVKYWLCTHRRWLLIFDNVDDPSVIGKFIPTRCKGHVLLTTRCQCVGPHIQNIEVTTLGRQEGVLFLLRRAKRIELCETSADASKQEYRAAQQVYDLLDGLPLALDQAAAYIDETQICFQDYLDLYAFHHTALLQTCESGGERHYPFSVATTWLLSFERIGSLNSAAADLLRLLAFLHPDSIPDVLLTTAAPELGDPLNQAISNPLHFNTLIGVLRRFSLIRRNPETKTLALHRLVQTVLIDAMSEEARYTWAQRTLRVVNRAFPSGEFITWSECQLYLPHTQACAAIVERWQIESLDAARLFSRAGSYLNERGHYSASERLLRLSLAINEQKLPCNHPDLARSLHDMGVLYLALEQYERAEPLLKKAFDMRKLVLPPDHPDLAASYNCMGLFYTSRGKYEQAEPLLQKALESRLKAFGPIHADVAGSLNELAMLYDMLGKYELAEHFYCSTVTTLEQLPGSPHLLLAVAYNNIAKFYTEHEKYAEAEQLFHQSLAIAGQVVGLDHPKIVIGLNNLAGLYLQQGKDSEAEALLLDTLKRAEQTWGSDHPYVSSSLKHLANLYYKQEKYQEAEALMERTLAIRERAFGSSHPSVADCCCYLAQIYIRQERYKEAETLYRRALSIQEEVLGPTHPVFMKTIKSFSAFLKEQGKELAADFLGMLSV
ncbi:MAG TPA: FxSxx-COOH system tetratricopeptide repeat protein [Ktedonobacteraceae bacterium]|nr:FxSxx-COOH system tetratricopeptide repeat protein [Ktedonobacteraceae bacterium]